MERERKRRNSIHGNAQLNERRINHKKLRAFKSPTRWRTFALITLHLSFLFLPLSLSSKGESFFSLSYSSSLFAVVSLSGHFSFPSFPVRAWCYYTPFLLLSSRRGEKKFFPSPANSCFVSFRTRKYDDRMQACPRDKCC